MYSEDVFQEHYTAIQAHPAHPILALLHNESNIHFFIEKHKWSNTFVSQQRLTCFRWHPTRTVLAIAIDTGNLRHHLIANRRNYHLDRK
jgi:hypothetical protein